MSPSTNYAAVFIDFENIYYYIQNTIGDRVDAGDCMMEMVRSLRQWVWEERSESVILQHAYADFEKLSHQVLGSLYLLGVETHNVLGTEHKNAADMRLCIDVMEAMYTRPEIRTFVFLAGDRDYIPVVQHLRKHARTVLVVAFQKNVSGDLLINVGEEHFLDAKSLMPQSQQIMFNFPRQQKPAARATAAVASRPATPPKPPAPEDFGKPREIDDENSLQALEILLHRFGHYAEVYVANFLRELRAETPLLADFERKASISDLEDRGAIRVEKRPGEPHDYSVILINWNHPDVQRQNPG